MKITTIFKSTLLLSLMVGLAGCASNLETQSSAEIEQQTMIQSFRGSPSEIISAPTLQMQNFPNLFYGSDTDTVFYNLVAHKDKKSTNYISYLLEFDASYGTRQGSSTLRRYDMAKANNGSFIPTTNLRHEEMRCQNFRGVGAGCLYRDRAYVKLSLADLEAGSHTGINLTLSSANKEYEHLYLPSHYVDGFLKAVKNQ
jgi:hypothetical protein